MKKNKEWAKKEIKKIHALTFDAYEAAVVANNKHFQMKNSEQLALINKILEILNQLDEPEVLSEEWIDSNSINASHDGVTDEYINVVDLKNLIVPKQDLPVIPKYVADWIEGNREWYDNIFIIGYDICNNDIQPDVDDWIMDNEEEFVRAWLDGYKVEEEQKYIVSDNSSVPLLIKNDDGKVMAYDSQIAYNNSNGTIELTEQEIKAYDERYMSFARPAKKVSE